jgi:spermidine/putrescine-binding protein
MATIRLEHRAPRLLRRREILKGTAAGAAALTAPAILMRAPRRAAAQENTVRILGVETAALEDWSEVERETGVKIEFTGIDSDPGLFVQEVIANEAGDDFDIFAFDGGIEDRLGAEGYLLPVDEAALKRWAEVSEDVKRSPLLQGADGTQYGVPLVFNADSFAYYLDAIEQEEPLSYKLLFDSEATLGQAALEDTWLTTLPMAALYLKANGLATIDNPANMTAAEAKTTVDFLIERKNAGQFRALWRTWEESVDLLKERGALDTIYQALDGFLSGAYGARIAVLRGYATGSPDLALEFAKESGWSAEEIEAIEANIEKVNQKFAADWFWQNADPDHVQDIEAEWQRFVQA